MGLQNPVLSLAWPASDLSNCSRVGAMCIQSLSHSMAAAAAGQQGSKEAQVVASPSWVSEETAISWRTALPDPQVDSY